VYSLVWLEATSIGGNVAVLTPVVVTILPLLHVRIEWCLRAMTFIASRRIATSSKLNSLKVTYEVLWHVCFSLLCSRRLPLHYLVTCHIEKGFAWTRDGLYRGTRV